MAELSKAELAAMAQEATVDAHDEDEQAMGFHSMIVDSLEVPLPDQRPGRGGYRSGY